MKYTFLAILLAALATGCSIVSSSVSSAGNIASGTIRTAGRTAASVTSSTVGAASDVGHSAVSAAGSVVVASAEAVGDVASAPFVIFKDAKTGKRHHIEWQKRMTVSEACRQAEIETNGRALRVIRGGKLVQLDDKRTLEPGDTIELSAPPKQLSRRAD